MRADERHGCGHNIRIVFAGARQSLSDRRSARRSGHRQGPPTAGEPRHETSVRSGPRQSRKLEQRWDQLQPPLGTGRFDTTELDVRGLPAHRPGGPVDARETQGPQPCQARVVEADERHVSRHPQPELGGGGDLGGRRRSRARGLRLCRHLQLGEPTARIEAVKPRTWLRPASSPPVSVITPSASPRWHS
jgi:hypothetical protein